MPQYVVKAVLITNNFKDGNYYDVNFFLTSFVLWKTKHRYKGTTPRPNCNLFPQPPCVDAVIEPVPLVSQPALKPLH